MNVLIKSAFLTDAPYSPETAAGFLFDDQVQLEQFTLELKHGHAGAYLISGYRGSGKTSFVNRLQEKLPEVVFVEINIAKAVTYTVLIKRIIRQLFLQYQAYCKRQKTEQGEFAADFQLLYDRTFHDIVNTSLQSQKAELKIERQWKLDLQKITAAVWKMIGPIVMFLTSGIALAYQVTPWLLLIFWIISILWGAFTAWTITRTKTDTATESKDVSRKSLYDDEIAEHHLFAILQRMKKAGLNMVIVFDELDKIEKQDQVKEIINDIKPMLLSGYASFIVAAGQALFYDLEKSAFQDDVVISTLFARTFHVPFLRNATLKKFCLNLIENDSDKASPVANDYFDSLILQSSRIPRRLVNLIRTHLTWENKQAHLALEEADDRKWRWRSRVLQAATYVVDTDLFSRYRSIVQQDFFTAQVFAWLGKMLTYESSGFRKRDIVDSSVYGDAYPAAWVSQLDIVWEALWAGLRKDGILGIQEQEDPEETSYFWIYETPAASSGTDAGDATEPGATTPPEVPDQPAETSPPAPTLENQSRFIAEFAQLEAYLYKLLQESGVPAGSKSLSFRQITEQLVSAQVFDADWLNSPAVVSLSKLRNDIVHPRPGTPIDTSEINNAISNLARLWAEVNERYTYYVLLRHASNLKASRTTEGGFDILGEVYNQRLALEVKTFRDRKVDSRSFGESIDKYENFRTSNSQPLLYGLLIFQNKSLSSNKNSQQAFEEKIRQSKLADSRLIRLFFIDMSDKEGIVFQIEQALSDLIVPPSV